jgi:hypothetical protein
MKMWKHFPECVFLVFIVSISVLLLTVVWLYWQEPPHLDLAFRLQTPVIKRGGDLVIRNNLDRPVNCASWWHRYIFNSSGTQMMGTSEYRPAGSPQEYVRSLRMPALVEPGIYTYDSTILWHCNWVQALAPKEVQLPELKFEVVP